MYLSVLHTYNFHHFFRPDNISSKTHSRKSDVDFIKFTGGIKWA